VNIDRESIRRPPAGDRPVHFQTWRELLFAHWPFEPEVVRPCVPPELELDLFDGSAWVGVVPFTMCNIHARGLPPIPGLRSFHELNVRTAAVWAARTFYRLPYFRADMSLQAADGRIAFASRRTHRGAPPATLRASWKAGDRLPEAQAGSLEFFLTERYCLYASFSGSLRRCRVWHEPWPLRAATLDSLESTMPEAAGLPAPAGHPLVHFSDPLDVRIYPMRPA
jgi:uncharacterized protein YqjF (DUF2071 family)